MKSDMENNEWADEEMSLKQVNKNNPFTVPVGYFEEAGQRILSLVKLEEKKRVTPHKALVSLKIILIPLMPIFKVELLLKKLLIQNTRISLYLPIILNSLPTIYKAV
ncbi:MAG: hypothetical protein JWP67_1306 [Mucilaginibacter sp.]|nr:hypothetical protein [Mucilaginibacter sp.]